MIQSHRRVFIFACLIAITVAATFALVRLLLAVIGNAITSPLFATAVAMPSLILLLLVEIAAIQRLLMMYQKSPW